MYYYNKNFWINYHSHKTTLSCEEVEHLDDPTPQQDIFNLYISASETDMSAFLGWYKQFSAFENSEINAKIPFEYNLLGDSGFKASVGFNNHFTKTSITLSLGLCIAIHDIMNRICCNQEVLNFNSKGQDTWQGTTCFYPQSELIPEIRFSLYKVVENRVSGAAHNTLGFFNCGVAVGSFDRMYMASLMEFISLTWILLHEEAHYWQGHLFYLEFNDEPLIDETKSNLNKSNNNLLKIFEWQADRGAIVDLMTMFFLLKDEVPFELPEQFEDRYDLSSYIRIVLCSIGTNIFIFQKNKLINKSEDYYPSPITRLATVVGIMYARLMMLKDKDRASLYHIKSEDELQAKVMEGLLSGLLDLYFVEDVLTNNVDFKDGLSKVDFEQQNPKSLHFFKDMDEINAFLISIIKQFDMADTTLYGKWFSEYNTILNEFRNVFDNVLPKYRDMASASGKSPYK